MKILIIEDEPKTAAFLKKGFTEEGDIVDIASNGTDGQHLAATGDFDVIVLDVLLPQRDGWWVLQEIRKRRADQPVILLTALDAVSQRVKGLQLGADDYLVKPFAFSELLARVHNILRRCNMRSEDVLHCADLEIDLLRHKVWRGGEAIDLAPQEYRLLSYLMRFPGEVLTRTRIAEQVWDMNFDGDSNVVDVAIRRLRRKVDDPYSRKLIHTLRGVGYVLETRD
ncbi:heavy metal response regulator transcription factor [Acidithiobacillus sp.]|jgi:two-component system copper resistance phosphate regulon response regulator CusR|uniref:heavy metal response regulator transcription factor n=1 Tax=Acidithiobacillus sp. TaxID=1872118 RepID=UPI0025C11192|nr:heavy metal response regulator transcription factor [Acidithiobacillus sp.]MCK9189456.1 heavy metal response regulator transcription factor [Acidithiobacillus sp.]MCK9359001.1 heavy metal response regulator transcription factor [Acidithiobacillus sp.]